ncbi:hypothetical protein SAMN04488524_4151 [Pedobacter africanus]|uniref:NVEALA protein n=1 Tax=Pedobacter africanus TaxID=151894 RepID=A0A1W2DW72_9SPHI|nr:hypothetical protein SAMN04488524_4151 [Pedobacter africanus]
MNLHQIVMKLNLLAILFMLLPFVSVAQEDQSTLTKVGDDVCRNGRIDRCLYAEAAVTGEISTEQRIDDC